MIAPTADGGIYYTNPSEDWTRPGQMWWSLPAGVDEFSTWREITTIHHEGAPGHHLQTAQVLYLSAELNRWQRMICWVSGHGEGWALYAERLMDELGYLSDPGDVLGMLDAQLLRAARVVVDIGVHLSLRVPADSPWQPGETWNARAGLGVPAGPGPDQRAHAALRAQPLPGLARAGAVVQARRADLAAGPRRTPGPARARTST